MCSTFKLLAVGAVLTRVDEGQERLDRMIRVEPADVVRGSPATRSMSVARCRLRRFARLPYTQ